MRTIDATDIILPERQRTTTHMRNRTTMRHDVEDAIFEDIRIASHGNTASRHSAAPRRRQNGPGMRIGVVAGAVERGLMRLSPQGFVVLLSTLFVSVFWLCGGFSALAETRVRPSDTASPWELSDLSIRVQKVNGFDVAMISGTVVNTSQAPIVPPAFAVGSRSHRHTLGTIALEQPVLRPGEHAVFSGSYQLAGGKASDIRLKPLLQ